MSELRFLSPIIEARLSDDLPSKELEFTNYFQCEFVPALESWEQRESTFAFLEHTSSPQDIQKALELTRLLRQSDAIINEIKVLNRSRENEHKQTIDPSLFLSAQSLEELIFIETLHDERLITQVSSLLGITENTLLKDTISILHKYMKDFTQAYRARVVDLEVQNDQDSWLAYPCISCKINKWSQHLDSSSFDFMEISDPLVDHLLDQVYNEWSELWQVETWKNSIHYQGENTDEETHVQVWQELFEPFVLELATEGIKRLRDDDLIEDLNTCFTSLIDAKRPKDQRIGSIWFDEKSPESITVMFLTRDGKLLAQRDITWDPQNADSILEAFEIINIRILTYPQGLEHRFPKAFEHLSSCYQLYPVSSVVLDPVPHPLSLSDNAQKALRIGQRFVAPLRFWARTDLVELMKCFTTPKIIDCLAESKRLDALQDRLQDSCAERWLMLRQKRYSRKGRKHSKPKGAPASSHDSVQQLNPQAELPRQAIGESLAKGDSVDVKVLSMEGYKARVSLLENGLLATLRLKRLRELKVNQVVTAVVMAIDPKSKEIKLSLKQANYKKQKKTRSTQDHSDQTTLNRLNKLFAAN
jgi:predicted RNA-binding protein with RPS1 domain